MILHSASLPDCTTWTSRLSLFWCALAAIVAAAAWLHFHTFINHDVAWVLWGTREMLNGAVFGRDIIEPNPPLAWYISMPPVRVAGQLDWPIAETFRAYVFLLALASLGACHWIMRSRLDAIGATEARLLTLLSAVWLLVFCYRDFGQREHLAQILILPYLFMAAARMRGGRVLWVAAMAIGICAGLGVALKPYFLAVPALVELTGIALSRRVRFAIRAETVAMGLVIAAYAAAVIVFAPLYLTDVMGAAQRIYWSFNVPLTQVLSPIAFPAGAFLCVLAMLPRTGIPPLPAVLSAAACGFLISYLVQMKGYSYQAFPFVMNSVLALAALLLLMVPLRRTLLFAAGTVALVAVVAGGLVHTRDWWMAGRKGSGHAAEMSQALVDTINAHAAGGGFLAISTHPSPGFPAALGVEADWTSRTNSQWFLPAVAQLREGTRAADPATLAFAERQARAFILHDLAA